MRLKTGGVCLVTGASSGIGRAIACRLAKEGMRVYGTSRRETEQTDGVTMLRLDLGDTASIAAAVDEVIRREGRIDLLVNNAGAGISGAIEDTSDEDIRLQMNAGFLGHVAVTRAVLPHMRSSGGGRILFTGSVAAGIPIPYQAMYSAAKAAIRAFASALAGEVKSFSIDVTVIEPGDTRTAFTDRRIKTAPEGSAYTELFTKSVAVMEHDERTGDSPDQIAAAAVRAALARHPAPRITVGLRYKAIDLLRRLLPERWTDAIIHKIYG